MRRFNGRDMAVYTEVSDDALRAFLALYEIGEVISIYPHPVREAGES
jgi:hypothetical protein